MNIPSIIEIILLLIIIGLLLTKSKGFSLASLIKNSALIIDSCGLIDGRLLEITAAGFITDRLIIPQFVISELQLLADGPDSHKRERARFGLDVVQELQDNSKLNVVIDRTSLLNVSATDDKLIALAKKLGSRLYTTDYNLGKVAKVEGIEVLNVNELAQHLRLTSLPGETITTKIIQRGSSENQGVGYLEDGTMVVVDGATKLVGKNVSAKVVRIHQTVAGKMIFAKLPKSRSTEGRQAAASTGSMRQRFRRP